MGSALAGVVIEVAACIKGDGALVHAGEQLYPVLNTGSDAFAQAVDAICGTQVQSGRQCVALTTPMGFAARWLASRLGGFATQHPEVDLRIHASDTTVDPHGGSADLAVRYGDTRATGDGLTTEHLFGDVYALVCHSGLNVWSRDGLTCVPFTHSGWQHTLPQVVGWPMRARAVGIDHMLKTGTGAVLPDDGHAVSTAMAGQGVILANPPLVCDALEVGMLVQPFTTLVIRRYAFWAVAPSARLEDAAVRAVRDWLCACRENTARVHRSV